MRSDAVRGQVELRARRLLSELDTASQMKRTGFYASSQYNAATDSQAQDHAEKQLIIFKVLGCMCLVYC